MPTFKLELFKSKILADGRHPVCIRVTHGPVKRKAIASAFEDEWDEKNEQIKPRSRPDWKKTNFHIQDEFNKYQAIYLKLKGGNRAWRPEQVFDVKIEESFYFLSNSNDYLNYLKAKDGMSYNASYPVHNKIKEFVKDKDFLIEEITTKWLNNFELFCAGRKNQSNTITYALKYIKRVLRYIGVENKVVDRKRAAYTETIKPKLTIEEIQSIEKLALKPGSLIYHVKNAFLFQFYMRGMRIGDLLQLRPSNVKKDRIVYQTSKTSKPHDIELNGKALAIIKEYYKKDNEWLFPFIRIPYKVDTFEEKEIWTKEYKNRTMIINRYLKSVAEKAGITKNVSSHTARHSFAALADLRLDGNVEMIQKLLGHSSRGVTERYLAVLRKSETLDTAASKIFEGI